ncbi:MAG: hypothetical protein ABI416_10900 [Ginsengibacter sp.]
MATKIMENLPVKYLNNAVAFVANLYNKFNNQFNDEEVACMIIGEDTHIDPLLFRNEINIIIITL